MVKNNIHKLRDKYGIENGFIQGIGAVDKVKLGNYNVEKKDYKVKEFEGSFEVTSFSGNIGPDKIHAHITISDPNFVTKAGHCDLAKVSGTFELIIITTEGIKLNHKYDEETGLDVFNFVQS